MNEIKGCVVTGIEMSEYPMDPPKPGPTGLVLRPPAGITGKQLRDAIGSLTRPMVVKHEELKLDRVKLILPAGLIPDGAKVIKITGVSEYVLRKQIKIYTATGHNACVNFPAQTLESRGTRYLVGDNGDINAVDTDKELIWLTDRESACEFLDPPEDK